MQELKKQAKKMNINLDSHPLRKLLSYMEKEGHPKAGSTAKVLKRVVDKLEIAPDYYERLAMMELKAAAHWRARPRKPLYNPSEEISISN